MAKVYCPPAQYPDPPKWVVKDGWPAHEKKEIEWTEGLVQFVKARLPDNDLVGEVLQFGVADGFAQYMVWNTSPRLELLHLPLGDSYCIPDAHSRGLTVKDVRLQIKQGKAMEAIFAKHREEQNA